MIEKIAALLAVSVNMCSIFSTALSFKAVTESLMAISLNILPRLINCRQVIAANIIHNITLIIKELLISLAYISKP